MRKVVPCLIVASALAACSKEDPPPPPPPGCIAFGGDTCSSGSAVTATTCAAASGTWSPSGCTGQGAVSGICAEAGLTTYYYFDTSNGGGWATWEAEGWCAYYGGAFTAAGATVVGTCSRGSDPLCIDGSGTESDMFYRANWCAGAGGTWADNTACTTSGRDGTCSYEYYGIAVQERYYVYTTAIQAGCTDTWTPG